VPPSNPPPGSPQDWLNRAQAKLALARQPLPAGGVWEDLCYMAQQAAELAIKSVYQQHGWLFPFMHDLAQLLNGLQKQGLTIPVSVQEANKLTVYATLARYPGLTAPAAQAHHTEKDRPRRTGLGRIARSLRATPGANCASGDMRRGARNDR
jgi:HEPN domain-containing protein